MNLRTVIWWIGGALLVAAGWRAMGWPGVALVVGAALMWVLLHFTRLMSILKRAANRPKGWVNSAVMLNARLRPGLTLLEVVGITRALGDSVSTDPEIWRWTDNGGSFVTCHFERGRLVRHELTRPGVEDDSPPRGQDAAP